MRKKKSSPKSSWKKVPGGWINPRTGKNLTVSSYFSKYIVLLFPNKTSDNGKRLSTHSTRKAAISAAKKYMKI